MSNTPPVSIHPEHRKRLSPRERMDIALFMATGKSFASARMLARANKLGLDSFFADTPDFNDDPGLARLIPRTKDDCSKLGLILDALLPEPNRSNN